METDNVEVVGVVQQITKAEAETQLDIARRYPRDLIQVREKVLQLATLDQETAAACFYSLPRGGRTVTGNSVRLAEILAGCYQHLRIGTRVVETDLVRGVVTSQGICHDVENNVSVTIEKQRKIQRKKNAKAGDPYDEDMITLTCNANSAIAFRDAVFKVVPAALIKPIIGKIKEAARGKGTMDERRAVVMKRLKELFKLDEKRVFAAVGIKSVDDIDLSILDRLIGMGTAIKDGEYTVKDLFPEVTISKPKIGAEKGKAADNLMGKQEKDDIPMESDAEKKEKEEKAIKSTATKLMKVFRNNSISEDVVMAWCFANKHSTADHKKVADLPLDKIVFMAANVDDIIKDILPPS